ncbi:S8 family peptidase [Streptomyces himalayensis]|uniref:S8 family serine peptidase n=1 Tax=Streptomyces himalayensis subsp. himalayensis TaxID=2756131 RepID=A0A7W0DQR9_9ACTN|nr:S8 family serine peptidase [Streptomyces himalayensis]MBA2949048.1 S8 family serine peptidase [Streptomyces himalayensis subsp. himalayensis]
MKRACATTVAAAAAVALAAGMTNPASANGENSSTSRAAGAELGPKHRITLITGDRVLLDAKGRVAGLERAKGREHIPVQKRTANGHTYVVPFDAQRLIAAGKLDQRLFDVTELNKAANRKAQKKGLKLIVGYKGASAAAAKAEVRDAGDTQVRRTLKTLNADAVTTPKDDASELWDAVTREQSNGSVTTTAGVGTIWLDGVRKASLDKSVPQIGAPKAWAAGYDGKGVKIAVLDTGIDATHPDLKDQVIAEKNFSTSADALDRFGHGTHVASIAAGTGAKGGGTYKGVAPGAKLLNGKVLGDDSGILAGMEWAAEQGAQVVNLSLGGPDTPAIDPLEAEINKLSAEKGILFAVAAGNSGPNSLGSPGSADAALTVGAVDDGDELADFSSTGPRVGDGAIKPDVTAPGVDITAAAAPGSVIDQEVGQKPDGYLTISGTSMATPHVAGAAAILKQQHPDWTYAELKGALAASTKGGKYTPFQQGSGRVQVDKAITQSVIADPVSVSFGAQQWPHTDDTPVTKQVTYRNLGTKDVTLDLTATATNPKGAAAPAGFFTLGAKQVTVPAGGKASVDLTVNSKLGGTTDGTYSAYVVATGGGQSVRTAAAVEREVESYDVTLSHIGRDGKPSEWYSTDLTGVSGNVTETWFSPYEADGTVTVRVPKGGYVLNSGILVDPDEYKGADWLAQPKLSVTKDTTITLDARTAKPVDITVPDAAAESVFASPDYTVETDEGSNTFGWWLDSYANFGTRGLGPQITDGSLYQQWDGHWTKGATAEYDTKAGARVKQLATGYTKHYKKSELATVKVGLGASAKGKEGAVTAWGYLPDSSSGSAISFPQQLPSTRTLYLSTANKVKWTFDVEQYGGTDEDGWPITEAGYTLGTPQTFKGGTTYTKTFNTGVFGPRLSASYGVFRDGNTIAGYLPMYADGKNHAGYSQYLSVKTTLYRNGTKIAETEDPLDGSGEFKVPSADAAYKLTTSIKRSVKVGTASTRVDTSWSFRSKKTTDMKQLPLSTARFGPALGLDSTAPAGKTQSVPVTVQGAAKGSNLKSLSVYVSYDYGKTWKKLSVKNGKVSVKNPAKGKGISFHAKITDKKGNKSTVSIYNAYYGK